MSKPTPEQLEQLIHKTLRALPEHKAPRSLEYRVLSAIAARQALPWWRQPFSYWPLAARGAFLVISAILVAALLAWFFRTSGELQPAALFAGPLAMLAKVQAVTGGIGDFCATVWRNIPSLWLYGAAAFVGIMYATLFGLSAAAYRTFFAQR